jgi:hypothetical protein
MSLIIEKSDILNCKKELEKKMEAFNTEDDATVRDRDRKNENKEKEKLNKIIATLSKK